MEVRQELKDSVPEDIVKVKQEPFPPDEYYWKSENPPISPTNFPAEIKKEPCEIEDLQSASELYVKISELDKIIKEDENNYVSPKTEILTTYCDFPAVKSENFNKPSSSSRSRLQIPTNKRVLKKNKRKYPCPVCLKRYTFSNSRLKHLKEHFGKYITLCMFCGKFFIDKFEFLYHYFDHIVKNRSNISKPNQKSAVNQDLFVCDICLKSYTLKSSLKQHTRTHTGERPFKCEICTKSFFRNYYLKNHMLVHTGEKPFKCEICSKTYGTKTHLKRHTALHSKLKLFKCKICLRQYTDKSSLFQHKKYMHVKKKQFKCYICSMTFSLNSTLRTHLVIHSDVKPFKCQICPKTFKRKGDVSEHMITHSNQKMFGCAVCSKQFKRKKQLGNHFIIHTGEKPFKCDICSRTFNRKSNLTAHLKKHL